MLECSPRAGAYACLIENSEIVRWDRGEIVGGERGRIAAGVGYAMWDEWREYTAATGGLHEFTSPTYTCLLRTIRIVCLACNRFCFRNLYWCDPC
jgi:hypothetical protein